MDGWAGVRFRFELLLLDVDNDVLSRLLDPGYFLESVAFLALTLYLETDRGTALIGFFALDVDDEGVDGIEGFELIDVVDGTVDIKAEDDDLFSGNLLSGFLRSLKSP